jgi:hypothetical protein
MVSSTLSGMLCMPPWLICTATSPPSSCTACVSFARAGIVSSRSMAVISGWALPVGCTYMCPAMISPTPPRASSRYKGSSPGRGNPSSSEAMRSAVAERTKRFGSRRRPMFPGVSIMIPRVLLVSVRARSAPRGSRHSIPLPEERQARRPAISTRGDTTEPRAEPHTDAATP